MKINPRTAELFTDDGQFLKRLHCPLRKGLDGLKEDGAGALFCDSCHREIHDTARLSDDELRQLVARDPEVCLMISPMQQNVTVLPRLG
jgi:hypothetical protein